jgi:hypothetical protein
MATEIVVAHQACHPFIICNLPARDRARELHAAPACMTSISPDAWVRDDDLTIGKRANGGSHDSRLN